MRFFCSGVTRPNTVCCSSTSRELGVVLGQLARVEPVGDVEPDLAGDRGDRARVVARDDPDADALLRGSTSSVCAASGRTCSRNVSTTTGATPGGSRSASTSRRRSSAIAECARTSVRRPVAASSVTVPPSSVAASVAASPNTISGAPSTHVPRPGRRTTTALHLRADENGMYAVDVERRAHGIGASRRRARWRSRRATRAVPGERRVPAGIRSAAAARGAPRRTRSRRP